MQNLKILKEFLKNLKKNLKKGTKKDFFSYLVINEDEPMLRRNKKMISK